MRIESMPHNGYMVLYIREKVLFDSSMEDVALKVNENITRGNVHIALALPPDSMLASRSIGVLLNCNNKLKNRGGGLSLIIAQQKDAELLEMLSINTLINIYSHVNDLPPLSEGD